MGPRTLRWAPSSAPQPAAVPCPDAALSLKSNRDIAGPKCARNGLRTHDESIEGEGARQARQCTRPGDGATQPQGERTDREDRERQGKRWRRVVAHEGADRGWRRPRSSPSPASSASGCSSGRDRKRRSGGAAHRFRRPPRNSAERQLRRSAVRPARRPAAPRGAHSASELRRRRAGSAIRSADRLSSIRAFGQTGTSVRLVGGSHRPFLTRSTGVGPFDDRCRRSVWLSRPEPALLRGAELVEAVAGAGERPELVQAAGLGVNEELRAVRGAATRTSRSIPVFLLTNLYLPVAFWMMFQRMVVEDEE